MLMVFFQYAVAKLTIITMLIAYTCIEFLDCTIRLIWLDQLDSSH